MNLGRPLPGQKNIMYAPEENQLCQLSIGFSLIKT